MTHPTRLESLATRIATHIAGHPVAVRCDAGLTSPALVVSSTAELAPEICWPLHLFAKSSPKPVETAHMSPAYWAAYDLDATAVLTLATASAHLSGVSAAKAACLGLAWMPYVAEQLGDTPAHAQALAVYARGSNGTSCVPANK